MPSDSLTRAIAAAPSEPPPLADEVRIVAVGKGPERELELDGLARALEEPACRIWVDLTEPTGPTLSHVAEALGLHPLVVEDIQERNQRAKIEVVDEVLHIVMFSVEFVGAIHAAEIDVVLGERFLLTAHGTDWDPLQATQLRQGPAAQLERGPDYLLYTLCDWVVDGYFPVLDRLADDIDQLQDDVVAKPTPWTLERLFALKRELINIRRATSPAREIFNQLTNRQHPVLRPEHLIYFRDVYDHLIRVTDELDNYRELVSGTLDVYLSTINNNLSAIMKRLTGVTVIVAGIGAVAGIFGMSEAGSAFAGLEAAGFWLVTAATITIAVAAAVVLHRIDWI